MCRLQHFHFQNALLPNFPNKSLMLSNSSAYARPGWKNCFPDISHGEKLLTLQPTPGRQQLAHGWWGDGVRVGEAVHWKTQCPAASQPWVNLPPFLLAFLAPVGIPARVQCLDVNPHLGQVGFRSAWGSAHAHSYLHAFSPEVSLIESHPLFFF